MPTPPIQELNTHPFLPPKPILIIEPNQLPFVHENIPVVTVTPEPVLLTTVAAKIVETTQKSIETEATIGTTESTITTAATSIVTEKSSEVPTEATSTTVQNISVEISTAAVDVSTTKKSTETEVITTEKVSTTTTEEIIPKSTTTTEKPVEPIIIHDLVPFINEPPLPSLINIIDEVVEKSLPLVQHSIIDLNGPETDHSSSSPQQPIVEAITDTVTTTVAPPRPKAFIRSINADLIKQVSPSARKFLNAKESDIADINDMLYKFNYTAGFHGHMEQGDMTGSKNGEYFIVGRDNIKRTVKYTASKHGFVPSIRFGPVEDDVAPKPETEKEFGMRGYEFQWYLHKTPESSKNTINDK